MQFYIASLLSFILVIIPAVITFQKEKHNKFRSILISTAILGAVLSFCTGYNAHEESERNADTARMNDGLYKSLLNQNLVSAHKIIDSLDTAVIKSRALIGQNNVILSGQHTTLDKLKTQLMLSARIETSVIKSGNKLLSVIDSTKKQLNDQLSDENRYAYLRIEVSGYKLYNWFLVNPFKDPVYVQSLTITDYDKLLTCKQVIQKPRLKIDENCFWANTLSPLDLEDQRTLLTAPYGQAKFDHVPLQLIDGFHRYEIRFTLKNRSYIQHLYLLYDERTRGMVQSSQLLTVEENPKIIGTIPSNSEPFNNLINWRQLFPLTLVPMLYKM